MADYLDLNITADSTQLADDASLWLEDNLPGWTPAAGNLETLLFEAVARMASQIAVLCGRVPVTIFRYFGQTVLKVASLQATAATATTVWTLTDTLGYVIPAGTQITIRDVGFETTADVTVPAGSSTATVTVVATVPGAAGSGLSTPVALVDTLTFVSAVAVTGVSTGGTDGETDTDYVNRLADELPTLSPKAILLTDFEALARTNPAVGRALAIDNFVVGVNEIATLVIAGATGGTFTLTYSGQTTGALAYNAAAADVQAALAALSNIGTGNVIVTGSAGSFVIEFRGVLGSQNLTAVTTGAGSLTPGGATATITGIRDGNATTAVSGAQGAVTVAVHDFAGAAVSSTVKSAIASSLADSRVLDLQVSVIDPTFQTVDVVFTAHCYLGWDPTAVQSSVIAALQAFLAPTAWGQPTLGQSRRWVDEPTVRRNDLLGVVYGVQGVRHVDTLTLALGGGTQATSDLTLPGPASLTRAGAITGTVTT